MREEKMPQPRLSPARMAEVRKELRQEIGKQLQEDILRMTKKHAEGIDRYFTCFLTGRATDEVDLVELEDRGRWFIDSEREKSRPRSANRPRSASRPRSAKSGKLPIVSRPTVALQVQAPSVKAAELPGVVNSEVCETVHSDFEVLPAKDDPQPGSNDDAGNRVSKPAFEVDETPTAHPDAEHSMEATAPHQERHSGWLSRAGSTMLKAKSRLHKSEILTDEKMALYQSQLTCLEKLVVSRFFELLVSLLIILNFVFIGLQTQILAQRALDDYAAGRDLQVDEPVAFQVISTLFLFAFFLELAVRWCATGFFLFLVERDRSWNLIDIGVVGLDLIGFTLELFSMSFTSNITTIRIIRIIRVVRVVKVVRVLKFFRELRLMVSSILNSLKSLLWVVIIIFIMVSMFGIALTAAVTSELDNTSKRADPGNGPIQTYFGSLDRSVLNLFMAMTGGNDWAEYYNAIQSLSGIYSFLFVFYIIFALLAVINIITGVFVENAMQASKADRSVIIRQQMHQKKAFLGNVQKLFDEIDLNGNGILTRNEFDRKLHDEKLLALFGALNLDAQDAARLFEVLDYDGSGEVARDEFLEGCWKLQGNSSLDIKFMGYQVEAIKQHVLEVSEVVLTSAHGPAAKQKRKQKARSKARNPLDFQVKMDEVEDLDL